MQSTLTVKTSKGSYPITIARGAIKDASTLLNLSRRVLVVTDEGVPAEYAEEIARASLSPTLVTLPSGEGTKSIAVFEKLLRVMLEAGFTRRDCVVAVGGGVIGDLAGFVASAYMRGIDFYNIPTTLLSQVDSSIGGKVAVNLGGIKNCVGAFYPPTAVLIDPDVLKTLPERQIASGLTEALKMSCTHDEALFALFEKGEARAHLDEVILAALKIKKAVVEADEKESSLRRVLNFGHTVGHGIETLAGFDDEKNDAREAGLYHGECVALGMLPMCAPHVRARLLPILKDLSLPTECDLSKERVLDAMMHDKKAEAGGIGAVLVDEIGSFRFETLTRADFAARITDTFPKMM